MKFGSIVKFLFLLFVFVGCSYQEMVRHYTGTSIRSSDYRINGVGTYTEPVEATYSEFRNSDSLYAHFLQTGHRDTLLFDSIDSNCRMIENPPRDSVIRWSDVSPGGAKILRTSDSLTVFLFFGFGAKAFYMKQDSEWVAPAHLKFKVWPFRTFIHHEHLNEC